MGINKNTAAGMHIAIFRPYILPFTPGVLYIYVREKIPKIIVVSTKLPL